MTQDKTPTPDELEAFRGAFDWDGWTDPKAAQRAFGLAVLAKWGTPAPVGVEPVARLVTADSVPAVAKGAPIAAYPPLPDLGDGSKLWGAIGRHHRAITAVDIDKAAKAVDEAAIAMLLSYVDADRAARKQGGA